jgi:hypothetical protein
MQQGVTRVTMAGQAWAAVAATSGTVKCCCASQCGVARGNWIECDAARCRLLAMNGYRLTGSIPSSFANLTALRCVTSYVVLMSFLGVIMLCGVCYVVSDAAGRCILPPIG